MGTVESIRIAKRTGFCYGVREAIDKAKEASAAGKATHTLGQVVHNEGVISDLERLGIQTTLRRYPLTLGAAVLSGHERLRTGGMIGVVLDFTRARHRSVDPSMTAVSDDFRTGVGLRVVGILDVKLVGLLGLFLALGVDAPLNPARYNVSDGERLWPVYEPWPVQPVALLGLTAAL